MPCQNARLFTHKQGSHRDCQQPVDGVSSLCLLGRADGEAGRLVAGPPIVPILQASEKAWVQDERWLGDGADQILPPSEVKKVQW